jgi:hypothetical protein
MHYGQLGICFLKIIHYLWSQIIIRVWKKLKSKELVEI